MLLAVTDEAPSWADVEARYDDPAVHDAFVAACHASGRLRHAAECYRTVLAARPDDPVALRKQKQITSLALLAITLESARRDALRGEGEPGRGRRWLPVVGTAIGAAIGGLGAAATAFGPEAATGVCDGVLRGSVLCIVPAVGSAVVRFGPFVVVGGFAGLVGGILLRRS